MVGFGFVELFACKLNVEVLRAGKTQHRRQINRVRAERRSTREPEDECVPVHFASVAVTGWPSVMGCLPTRMTGWFSVTPSVISTLVPSSKPVFTGTFFALPSAMTNTD